MVLILPLQIIRLQHNGMHFLLECTISKENYFMVLDTGSSNTVFDESFIGTVAKETRIKGEISSHGINSGIPGMKMGVIKDFMLGNLLIKRQKGLFMDLSHINSVYSEITGIRIAGLIGADLLKKYNAIIDFKKATLTLRIKTKPLRIPI